MRDLLAHDRGSGPAQSTIDSSISASVQHRVRTQAAPLCERSVGLTPPLSGRCCTPKRQNARFERTNARGLPAPGATSPHDAHTPLISTWTRSRRRVLRSARAQGCGLSQPSLAVRLGPVRSHTLMQQNQGELHAYSLARRRNRRQHTTAHGLPDEPGEVPAARQARPKTLRLPHQLLCAG